MKTPVAIDTALVEAAVRTTSAALPAQAVDICLRAYLSTGVATGEDQAARDARCRQAIADLAGLGWDGDLDEIRGAGRISSSV